MLKRLTWMTIMLVALVAFVGCSDDDNPVADKKVTNFETIATAVEAYLPVQGSTSFITADALNPLVNADPPTVTVFDIRRGGATPTEHFDAGHIKGAISVDMADIVTAAETAGLAKTDNIVVTCYTGQSAGHAVAALRLMGYVNAKTLKFGMSSWNSTTPGSHWVQPAAAGETSSSCKDNLPLANIETTANALTTEYPYPSGLPALEDAVAATLTAGFKAKTIESAVAAGLDNYFIVNYVSDTDYMGGVTPGHIEGAFQFTPGTSIDRGTLMKYLPSDDTQILVYCYTGQSSSQLTFLLNTLGYEAYSLAYGMNHLFYNHEDYTAGSKWVDTFCKEYPLEMTPDEM